ncbi:peptidase S8/S53 domain-containing protein [Spinellus fusiger]|nr:peptidase S8/S53 domain-containing protein [Spinellus fusiger]
MNSPAMPQRGLLFLFLFLLPLWTTLANASSYQHNAYIVELASSAALSDFTQRYTTRYAYDSHLLLGASVQFASSAEATKALRHSSVLRAWPITHQTRPTLSNDTPVPVLETFDKDAPSLLTQQNNAYQLLGQSGEGIKIGVIDSGVDYTHPALGGCFGKGCKVAYGYDLVGDMYNGAPDSIKESSDPMDTCTQNSTAATGHGTFVSGIIAADDHTYNWTGVAPGVTLGMWRVFGCNYSGVSNDILIKAMEMAYKDGMDIINMSLGDHGGWEEDVMAVVADRLVALGVHVVAASGNIGTSGIFLTAAPATGRDVIAVAASVNDYAPGYILQVNTRQETLSIPYRTFVINPISFNQSLPIVSASPNFDPDNDACEQDGLSLPPDSIVLIRQGGCSSAVKVENARNAGAKIALIYTSANGTTSFEVITGASLPVAFINHSDGKAVFDAIRHAVWPTPPTAQFTKLLVPLKEDKEMSRNIASFSSLGPTNELQLKPELTAVGGNVFSTFPAYKKGYGFMSGTSMAAPFVSGSLALLLHRYPMSPGEAKRVLMNYASPANAPIDRLPNYGESPIRQGAGLIDIVQAIEGYEMLSAFPPKLSFNDTAHYQQQTLVLYNHQDTPLQVTLHHAPSLSAIGYSLDEPTVPLEPVSFAVNDNSVASLSFSQETVELPANSSVTISIDCTPPSFAANSHVIYGGSIELEFNSHRVRVPYIGMVGTMSSLPILQRTPNSQPFPFPSIGNPNGTILGAHLQGHYDITPGSTNLPFVLARLSTGTAMVQIQVLKGHRVIGDVPLEDSSSVNSRTWLPRNTLQLTESSTVYHSWRWTGVYLPVPDATVEGYNDPAVEPRLVRPGLYRLRVRALRVFGDRHREEDWDTWTSPQLKLHRFQPSLAPSVSSLPMPLSLGSLLPLTL